MSNVIVGMFHWGCCHLLETSNQVAADSAANATIVHLDDVLLKHRTLLPASNSRFPHVSQTRTSSD